MGKNVEKDMEDKILIIFKAVLLDMSTDLFFHKKLEELEDVVVLKHSGQSLALYKISMDDEYIGLSPKWEKKFKNIKNLINFYNDSINNHNKNEKPIYVKSFENTYDKIIAKISKKTTFLNKTIYGDPWHKYVYKKSLYFIKFNQLSFQISQDIYNEYFMLSINVEKQKTSMKLNALFNKLIKNNSNYEDEIIDDVINTDVNKSNLELKIDDILDKINKSGIDSLTQEEKDFLNKNKNK